MSDETKMGWTGGVSEGTELWRPTDAFIASSNLKAFEAWLKREYELEFVDYESMWQWSVTDLDAFWTAIWRYFDILSDQPIGQVVAGGEGILGARWFEGTRVNYAEHVLRHAAVDPDATALYHATEDQKLGEVSWRELAGNVRAVATYLRKLGLQPGDRVIAYMPNVPATVIAMLAVTAAGGVWAAASPEFGHKTVLDRFSQIEPKFAFFADGYTFGGKKYDRRDEIRAICGGLPTLDHVIGYDHIGGSITEVGSSTHVDFADVVGSQDPGAESFKYYRAAFDHPLWILFSSGTTGKPKAIVHSHVGIVAEHLKYNALHNNFGPNCCAFYFTTVGWMAWNITISVLMTGGSIVLYDGSPVARGADWLWQLVEATGTTHFAAGPTLIQLMEENAVRPRERFDLGRLQAIMLGGAPCSPENFAWFYRAVKDDLWIFAQSGGTEICSATVGGIPGRPCFAGEIPGRLLGMDVHAWNDQGDEVIDNIGELVITAPFPSAPLRFWNDSGDETYRDTYFGTWPSIWRHGDQLKVNRRGGCYVYGRSDSTLNRFGIRIGTGEIYNIVGRVEGVEDSLIICCELPGGRFFMPLFVMLTKGTEWNEALRHSIVSALQREGSPRHVPDEIHVVPAIPYTITGKKMEVPVRKIMLGAEIAEVANADAMSLPSALDWYAKFRSSHNILKLLCTG